MLYVCRLKAKMQLHYEEKHQTIHVNSQCAKENQANRQLAAKTK